MCSGAVCVVVALIKEEGVVRCVCGGVGEGLVLVVWEWWWWCCEIGRDGGAVCVVVLVRVGGVGVCVSGVTVFVGCGRWVWGLLRLLGWVVVGLWGWRFAGFVWVA